MERKVNCYQLELGKQLAGVSIECFNRHQGALMTTAAFSQNIGKLLSKLKLVTVNLPLDLVGHHRDKNGQ